MDNQFKDIMSKKSTKELLEILKVRDQYQPKAIEAAIEELKKRNVILESGELNIDAHDDFDFSKKISSSNNDELMNIFQNDYFKLSQIEIDILGQELKKRNIEPKVWFYTKNDQKYGPYNRTEFIELANNGTFDYYDYIFRNSMKNWIEGKNVNGLFKLENFPLRIGKTKPTWLQTKKKRTIGIIISAVILFFTLLGWLLLGFAERIQIGLIQHFIQILYYIMAIVTIPTGIGILLLKRWAYIIISIVNVVIFILLIFFYTSIESFPLFALILIPFGLGILLSKKRWVYISSIVSVVIIYILFH